MLFFGAPHQFLVHACVSLGTHSFQCFIVLYQSSFGYTMSSVNAHLQTDEEGPTFWDTYCPKKRVNVVAPRILDKTQRVDVGSFVQLNAQDADGNNRVVRILDLDRTSSRTTGGTKWKCQVCDRFVGSSYEVSKTSVVIGLGANVPELILTDKIVCVSAHAIRSIALVFHFMELDTKAVCLHGVENGYFVRFCVVTSHEELASVDEIPLSNWIAYPCESEYFFGKQSFVKTVFVCLDYIKHYIGRAANRYGDSQGTFPRSRFSDLLFPPEAWEYIKSRSSQLGNGVTLEEKVKKRKVCRIVSNVSISSVSFCMVDNTEVLRFQTEEGVKLFEQIFGIGSVWGFRHRRPKYGQRMVAKRNDTMNSIFGDGCYVELSYNTTANRLVIIVQMDSFLFDFDVEGKMIDCPCPRFQKYCSKFGVDDPENIKNAVVVGAYFRLQSQTYEIVNVKNGFVGPPDMSDATVYARVRDGSEEGEVHEFTEQWENIGERVLAYYN